MFDSGLKEHPLSAFLQQRTTANTVHPGVSIEVVPFVDHYNLRGDALNESFVQSITAAYGQELPLAPNTVSRGAHRIYWLGPSEWLVISKQGQGAVIANSLRRQLADQHMALTDLSGGQVLLKLSGPDTRNLLAKGSTLDLHESVFLHNQCAQSTMAKAAALFALADSQPVFELIIRRSFADYLAHWFDHAGREFGVEFTQHDL